MNKQESPFELGVSVDINDKKQKIALMAMLKKLPLGEVIEGTLQAVGIHQPVQLALIVTEDRTIQAYNRQFRHQDKPTDVLSFPLLDAPLVDAPAEQLWMSNDYEDEHGHRKDNKRAFIVPPEKLTNIGDIMISWQTVQRQAREAGHSTAYELLFLLSHGILHLVGYDDQSESGYQAMVGIQESVLQAVGQRA